MAVGSGEQGPRGCGHRRVNRRVEGVTQAQVLLNLGRHDKLDPEGLRRLVASINRYLREPAVVGDMREAVGDALTVTDARPLGAVWLLDGLWRQLGLFGAVRGKVKRTTIPGHRTPPRASGAAAVQGAGTEPAVGGRPTWRPGRAGV